MFSEKEEQFCESRKSSFKNSRVVVECKLNFVLVTAESTLVQCECTSTRTAPCTHTWVQGECTSTLYPHLGTVIYRYSVSVPVHAEHTVPTHGYS